MITKFILRIPEELYNQIRKIAENEVRSINNQIEYILKEYIKRYEQGEK